MRPVNIAHILGLFTAVGALVAFALGERRTAEMKSEVKWAIEWCATATYGDQLINTHRPPRNLLYSIGTGLHLHGPRVEAVITLATIDGMQFRVTIVADPRYGNPLSFKVTGSGIIASSNSSAMYLDVNGEAEAKGWQEYISWAEARRLQCDAWR